MKRVWQTIISTIATLGLLAAVFVAGYFVGNRPDAEPEVVEVPIQEFDLQLPGEVEKRIVTEEEVISKLVECSHLTTYSGEYTVSKACEQSRYMIDEIAIPGTSNSISITCDGVVKVGCDMESVAPTVDSESGKIYIAMPEIAVLDNYVIWDSVECQESNNCLNPIEFSQYQDLVGELETMGLADVESKGIYAAAEENLKEIVKVFLADFEDYEVVFL